MPEEPVRSAPPAPSDEGASSWFRARVPRFVRWLALLFVASLMIPALTKQWSDRKQELQLKETLSTDISRVSANAVLGAEFAVTQQSGPEQFAARRAVLNDWLRERASIDPRFQVYFSGSDAEDEWGFPGRRNSRPSFRNAVLYYVLLACCDRQDRAAQLTKLRVYLGNVRTSPKAPDPWALLACGPQEQCTVRAGYEQAYVWLGERLLEGRRALFDQLLDANAAGFSSGWGDFIEDLNPLS